MSQDNTFWERFLILNQKADKGEIIFSYPHDIDDETKRYGKLVQAFKKCMRDSFDEEIKELKLTDLHASITQRQVKSKDLLFVGMTTSRIGKKLRRKELEFSVGQFMKRHYFQLRWLTTNPANFMAFIPKTRRETVAAQISERFQLNPK